MDIRKLLRPMCPLVKRQGFANTSTWMPNPVRSSSFVMLGYRSRRNVTESKDRLWSLLPNNHHQKTRQGSTFSSSRYRVNHGEVRTQMFPWLFNPDHQHRTLRPLHMKWRYRQNLMSSPTMGESRTLFRARNTPPEHQLPLLRHKSTLSSSKARPLSTLVSNSKAAIQPVTVPSHSPSIAPSIPTSSSALSQPSNASRLTSAQASNPPNPRQHDPRGRRKRIKAARHRFRLERQLKLREGSAPQHPSQLLSANDRTLMSASRRNRKKTRRAQRRKWESLSPLMLGANGPARRYLHVHYYGKNTRSSRIRFLNFQQFLEYSKGHSPRGQQALQREKNTKMWKMALKRRNSKHSWSRPFVRTLRKLLMEVDTISDLEGAKGRRAVRLTKVLLAAKGKGARLPNGALLYHLCNMEYKAYWGRYYLENTEPPETFPRKQRFSTEDYNTILERCNDLEDWGNGIRIAQLQLKRFRVPGFDFQSFEVAAPNTRTIHLLALMFVKCGRADKAKEMFEYLHRHYPYPIPIDVYTAYLAQLSTSLGQIGRMEQMVEYLTAHGPAPTTTIYNTLLKASLLQNNLNHGEAILEKMSRLGYSPDSQSYRSLIDASLAKLNMARAHYWLAEYERQGFEVRPIMLQPFMQTCVEQMIRCKDHSKSVNVAVDVESQSQEWMYKALQLLEFMRNRRIEPTATTFELLIHGFLMRRNLPEARKILSIMRGRPHLYTPAPRTWILLFDYYLAMNDHSSAMGILGEMREALQTSATPFARVPTRLYHQLFRHLIHRGTVRLSERKLYETILRQGRARPTEKQVVSLIWKLKWRPDDAERVYELLYSQTMQTQGPTTQGRKAARLNPIVVQGPIQMANVGVMRAKANSEDPTLHNDVWKNWVSMTRHFLDPANESQKESTWGAKRPVMAIAFEQVAKALRKVPDADQDKSLRRESDHVEDDWDMGQIRRIVGGSSPRLGLEPTYGVSGTSISATTTKHIQLSGRPRQLLQQLFKQQEFLQPLVDRRNTSVADNEPFTSNVGVGSVERLNNLKSSFIWVQENKVPIRIEGFNCYLESLLSHEDFETAKNSVERFLLEVHHPEESNGASSLALEPDVNTVKILNDHKRFFMGGQGLYEGVLSRGGPKLNQMLSKPFTKRATGTVKQPAR